MTKRFYLGLDVGGTKIEGAVAELNLERHSIDVLSKKRIPCIHDTEKFIESITNLITNLLSEADLSLANLTAIGIGLPGTLHPVTSIMLNGNTRFLIEVDVIKKIREKLNFNIPIFAQNDANLFALAEAWGGVGRTYTDLSKVPFHDQVAVGITLGTGVGGGFVSQGKILSGAHGSALEVGHVVIHRNGNNCYCGQSGCAETYLSGSALNKLMDSKKIFQKAEEGDFLATEILASYRKDLVYFLSIINNLFNPHYFVFGGGLSAQERLFSGLKEELENSIFLSKEYCPQIYVNQLGDSAGLFGAMIYASENV